MIQILPITATNQAALLLPNEPFSRPGYFHVTRTASGWAHFEEPATLPDQTFPEEHYQLEDIDRVGFAPGAFAGDTCVGLATYEYDYRYNRNLYLADLKVNRAVRHEGIGRKLLDAAIPAAKAHGNLGLCTVAQGSNLDANRSYLAYGFHIGGLNTNDYYHTSARGEWDIAYYLDF